MNKLLGFKKRITKIHRIWPTVYESTILIEIQEGLYQEILIVNGLESFFKINDLDYSIKLKFRGCFLKAKSVTANYKSLRLERIENSILKI